MTPIAGCILHCGHNLQTSRHAWRHALGHLNTMPRIEEHAGLGNAAYRHAGELANPRNDATDIAAALRKSDFQVLKPSMSKSLPLIARSATLHQPSQTPRPTCSSMRGMVFRWPRA